MSASFLRTSSGLSNQAIFYGVDVVVYIEGGEKSFTLEELERDSSPSENLDTMFWQKVFKKIRPRLRAHFKSIGSKESVMPICHLIMTGQVSRVVAALDRDWDHVNRRKLRHSNILYTRGYSWENDVYAKGRLADLCNKLALNSSKHPAIQAKIERNFAHFEKAFNVLVSWESALARFNAKPCSRDAIRAAIQIRTPNAPCVSRSAIATVLRDSRHNNPTVKLRHRRKRSCVATDLYGHGLERFSTHLLHHIEATELSLGKVSNDMWARMLIDAFLRYMRKGMKEHTYYRKCILAVRTHVK